MQDVLSLTDEVRRTLAQAGPVVALESTVIAHGLPHPHNLEAADAMEAAVRSAGAVPATIAVMDGQIKIGLTAGERDRLADPKSAAAKVSRRDLASVIVSGALGATTVSATMICAHAAGIRVFATGGIGGVHRGAEVSLDVSADLHELARTPVLTVSAGAKSILDLPKTREVLETLGVPVLGYRTDTMPAFHARDSGLPVDRRIDFVDEAARIAERHWGLGLGGLLLCNPVPSAAALSRDDMDRWIDDALRNASEDGITGKAVTPYLLKRIADASGGRSLTANKALLIANAGLGGAVACALADEKDKEL